MLDHDAILAKYGMFVVAENGDIVEINRTGAVVKVLISASEVTAEYVNLFCAAPVMYKTIAELLRSTEIIIKQYVANRMLDAAKPYIAFRQSLALTQAMALEGMPKVAAELRKAVIGSIEN